MDVGYGQLAWKLQSDPRVEVHDRTNVRTLDPASVAPAPELVVGDMSFISLTLVLPALVAAAAPDADFLLMVKPQFEIGKERLGHGGVVRNPEHHVETVETVARCAMELGSISLPSQPRHFPALAATSSISCTCGAIIRIPSIPCSSLTTSGVRLRPVPLEVPDDSCPDGSSPSQAQRGDERVSLADALKERGIDVVDDASGGDIDMVLSIGGAARSWSLRRVLARWGASPRHQCWTTWVS